MSPERNLYEIIGVSREASLEEIRRAYREAARRLHPDVNTEVGATELFLDIQRAYEILTNPEQRQQYDARVAEQDPPPEAGSLSPNLSVSVQFSRSVIPHLEEPQLVYALLEIQPPHRRSQATGSPPAGPPPLNLAVVIDRSTSMQGVRMDMVKAGVVELVRRLRPQDIFALIAFSDRAEVLRQAERVNDLGDIETRVRMLQTGGGTEILPALQAGMQELRRNLNLNYINHLILITDGRTYGDTSECLNLADWAANAGIAISGLGIGSEWNDEFLDELSTRSGANSAFISRPSDIHAHLKERLLSLERTYAEQLQLELDLPSGVVLRDAFRFAPEPARLPVQEKIPLGSLLRDAPLTYLLEFLINPQPPDAGRLDLLSGRLHYHLAADRFGQEPVKLAYALPLRHNPEPERPPQAVVQAAARITYYRMQAQAREEAAQGEYHLAARRLQNLAHQLMKQGNSELAQTVLSEADRLKRTRAFSEEGEKRVKYGTRAFLLPARAGGRSS